MKIAFLNITYGLVDRGAETFVKELSVRLNKKYGVTVIGGNRILPRRWPILWRFFIDPYGIYIFWWTLKNLPLIWRERFDIVFVLDGGWQVALVRLVTWFYGGKVIISGQSGIGWDDRVNLWSFPNAFVAISSLAKNWARKFNPFVRVEYIPNGVDLLKFKSEGRKLNFDLPQPVILCVAALTKQKRVDLAIKAVAELKNGSLLLVGDGDLRDKIYELGKKLLGNRFQLIKARFEELPEIYRAADLFTIPSMPFQSFEIVLVEAMATNLAVVANDDLIRREIVGGAGILVDPTNTQNYAKTLEKALDIKWSDKPRQQAEKFSWDKIAEQYEELFKKYD